MWELCRTVRFCIGHGADPCEVVAGEPINSFAAWPEMDGIGAFYELEVACRGRPDQVTGYLADIRVIDRAVREKAIPLIQTAIADNPLQWPGHLLPPMMHEIMTGIDRPVTSICWHLTPYYSLKLQDSAMNEVLLAQKFEFAAAHRLHCSDLTEKENLAVFDRCNNPNGHGHNYRLEAVAAIPLPKANEPPVLSLARLEKLVDQTVIQRFDHTNLNLDLPEFTELNPSVENITRVCFGLLDEPVRQSGARLVRVTVWETAKTSCTYPAG